jgi:type IV secretion system protein VirB6
MATSSIFAKIESIIDSLTTQLNAAAVSPQVNALQSILVAYITVWVMARGYMILAGKSQEPFKDMLFDATIKVIVIAVVFSPTWISLISDTIDGLNSWASGSISLYSRMDEVFSSALELSNKLIDQDSGIFDIPVIGVFSAGLVLFGFFIFAIPGVLIIITTTVTLKILIMLAPIMIFTLMFDWFKTIFTKWIELTLSNTLTVLLVGILMNAISGEYKDIVDKTSLHANGNNDLLYLGASVLIVSIIIAWIILMAKGIAQQLTFVSIEKLPGSAAREGADLAKKSASYSMKAASWIFGRRRK